MANALPCEEAEVQWSKKQDLLVWAEQCSDNQVTKLALSQHTWMSLHNTIMRIKLLKSIQERKTSLWRLYSIFLVELENRWSVMSDHI